MNEIIDMEQVTRIKLAAIHQNAANIVDEYLDFLFAESQSSLTSNAEYFKNMNTWNEIFNNEMSKVHEYNRLEAYNKATYWYRKLSNIK